MLLSYMAFSIGLHNAEEMSMSNLNLSNSRFDKLNCFAVGTNTVFYLKVYCLKWLAIQYILSFFLYENSTTRDNFNRRLTSI